MMAAAHPQSTTPGAEERMYSAAGHRHDPGGTCRQFEAMDWLATSRWQPRARIAAKNKVGISFKPPWSYSSRRKYQRTLRAFFLLSRSRALHQLHKSPCGL